MTESEVRDYLQSKENWREYKRSLIEAVLNRTLA